MSSQPLSWTEEHDGILKAWRNLKGNRRDFAHYVYDRCCAYAGPNHQLWAERMIEAALEAVAQQWQETAEKAEEAARSASVEEDRARVHVADLAEALAAVQADEGGEATAALNRAKLETAIGVCLAIREFVVGFQSRIEVVLTQMSEGPKPAAPADLPGDM